MITMGGDAELELVDTLDPFSEGIHFSVRRKMTLITLLLRILCSILSSSFAGKLLLRALCEFRRS